MLVEVCIIELFDGQFVMAGDCVTLEHWINIPTPRSLS